MGFYLWLHEAGTPRRGEVPLARDCSFHTLPATKPGKEILEMLSFPKPWDARGTVSEVLAFHGKIAVNISAYSPFSKRTCLGSEAVETLPTSL